MKRNILSKTLLELAKTSKTEVIESADNQELIDAASKLGIILPSPDLAVLKTVYAEIDKVNLNGVILPRLAVEQGLATLIGKQMNWEHMGAYQVCGYTIDAGIVEDKIEIVAVVFKSLFPEEFDLVKQKFSEGTLAVSFEIWNKNPETGESVVKELDNGALEINPIIFHGTGLLTTSKPACPKAKVYKLIAKENTEEIIFNQDLVYAEMSVAEPKCQNCGTCHCGEEEKIVEELKIEDKKVDETEKKVENAEEHLCPECQKPMKDDECMNEECSKCKTKKAAEVKPEETKVEAEVKPEEVMKTTPEETKVEAEVKPEEVLVERKVVKIVTENNEIVTELINDSGNTFEKKGIRRETRLYSDETSEVLETEFQIVDTYTQAQVEEKVNLAKTELNQSIELKDKEIVNLKTELDVKNQEIATLKIETAKINETIETASAKGLEVGDVVQDSQDKVLERQKKVNRKAFGHD
ncbi:MAG: hypothetical protein WC055_15265 [Melioribacteraceae bacterium]